jgi:hypothetical protein
MSPPASGEQVGTMWNFKTLASIPVLNVTVLMLGEEECKIIQCDGCECFGSQLVHYSARRFCVVGGGCIPLIQCNGFRNSGEGLSENAATDKYSCSKKRANKEMLKSLKAYK